MHLTLSKRLKFNGPNSMLRKWKEAGQRQSKHGLPIYWTSQRSNAPSRSMTCSWGLNLTMSHLEDAHETYARRLGVR